MKIRLKLFVMSLFLGLILLPVSVFADGNELTYTTEIRNWHPNNHLYVTVSPDIPTGVTSTWKLVCDEDEIPLTVGTGYPFASVSDECSSASFVETISFTGMTLQFSNLGLQSFQMTPATIDHNISEDASLSSSVQNYMFSGLVNTYYTVNYMVLNPVDGSGNITGDPYIREVYFSNESSEKTTNDSLGFVIIPNFGLRYQFSVRGNVANTQGKFFLDYDSNDFTDVIHTYVSGEEPYEDTSTWNLTNLSNFYTNPSSIVEAYYGFGDMIASADNDYAITILENNEAESFDDALDIDGNTFYLDYTVIAEKHVDSSDTGLFYNLWPFIVMILFGGAFLFFFFHKKKKKDSATIVDDELL